MSKKFKYFKIEEFNDRYSGANEMDISVIQRLDKAREIAGVPFFVTSGYRDKNHPESIKNPTSSHIKGLAVDIAVNKDNKDLIYDSLKKAGFIRLGVANNFIHCDMDYDKSKYLTWYYDGRPTQLWA